MKSTKKTFVIDLKADEAHIFEKIVYPAGEFQIRIKPEAIKQVEQADIIFIKANIKINGDLIALALLADALRHTNDNLAELHLFLPYLPYARADRRFVPGDCFGLKIFGSILDGIGFDKIYTFDAHSYKAKRYIANLIDVPADDFINKVIEDVYTKHRATFVILPDKGAQERYGSPLGYGTITCEKKRDPQTGKFIGFDVPIDSLKDADSAIIIDDLCDGGGTFLGIADKIKEVYPDIKLYLYVSHGIFSKGYTDLLKRFEAIYTTDSYPNGLKTPPEWADRIRIHGLDLDKLSSAC